MQTWTAFLPPRRGWKTFFSAWQQKAWNTGGMLLSSVAHSSRNSPQMQQKWRWVRGRWKALKSVKQCIKMNRRCLILPLCRLQLQLLLNESHKWALKKVQMWVQVCPSVRRLRRACKASWESRFFFPRLMEISKLSRYSLDCISSFLKGYLSSFSFSCPLMSHRQPAKVSKINDFVRAMTTVSLFKKLFDILPLSDEFYYTRNLKTPYVFFPLDVGSSERCATLQRRESELFLADVHRKSLTINRNLQQ